jgi:hypothetical protein
LKQLSDHPILLVDNLGRLAGLCDNAEIYRGLLRSNITSRPESSALNSGRAEAVTEPVS